MAEIDVDIFDTPANIAESVADRFVALVRGRQEEDVAPHVVVTGGSTGIAVLKAIRAHSEAHEIDWANVHVWWGDERFVPADDPERNDLQAFEALFDHVPVDPSKVHRVAASDGEFGDDVDAAAAAYAREIDGAFDGDPVFDILMLGVGEEGHTASIFPDSPAATDTSVVCAVRDCPKPPPTRVSMTFPTLDRGAHVWMMTAGESKADAVLAVLNGAKPVDIPAAGPRGLVATTWWIDEAAASKIPLS
ncbi:6-phosphogluconolactonase [Epidermidibacterium keratini]|uniref:6-phosphogluconolactonase n=1 Tax=Epidermidibacterium keratini TaxID=1891644 RepID=A0A7L4YSB9_9ACTN|nr:6-phosphogluconolactonase [Epidermidibacterium keratini]QHC02125.1 6-phosphogluconolactonase [Epidermidibacterium keratini]